MSHVHVNMEDSLCGRQPLRQPLVHSCILCLICVCREMYLLLQKNGPPESKSPPINSALKAMIYFQTTSPLLCQGVYSMNKLGKFIIQVSSFITHIIPNHAVIKI